MAREISRGKASLDGALNGNPSRCFSDKSGMAAMISSEDRRSDRRHFTGLEFQHITIYRSQREVYHLLYIFVKARYTRRTEMYVELGKIKIHSPLSGRKYIVESKRVIKSEALSSAFDIT